MNFGTVVKQVEKFSGKKLTHAEHAVLFFVVCNKEELWATSLLKNIDSDFADLKEEAITVARRNLENKKELLDSLENWKNRNNPTDES